MDKPARSTGDIDNRHPPPQLQLLVTLARQKGADDALLLPAAGLVVREELAQLCDPDRPCPGYGLAPGCPPHAMQPAAFRELVKRCTWMLTFKINAPMQVLLGLERRSIARQVHCISAELEEAVERQCRYPAHAYASGSCKDLFCPNEAACVVLARQEPCPHVDKARPSLSAVGIEFQALADLAGWPFKLNGFPDPETGELMGLMAGLVLIEDFEQTKQEEQKEYRHAHR